MFQHTAARRRLDHCHRQTVYLARFNTQPPEGGWTTRFRSSLSRFLFQHTAARRRLDAVAAQFKAQEAVSTHSRPKAAGRRHRLPRPHQRSFNTQPPEGGWMNGKTDLVDKGGFNTQPPEGGWRWTSIRRGCWVISFNTQPPEGGWASVPPAIFSTFGFNTQPPEGGWRLKNAKSLPISTVSTHSRPKAAGRFDKRCSLSKPCFNTQPPEGGWVGRTACRGP